LCWCFVDFWSSGSTNALLFDFVFHLQNTMMLRAIPGLKEVGKALLGIENVQFTFEM
jgi:hypothetical protein